MFTGIIEEMGRVQSIHLSPHGNQMSLSAHKTLTGLKNGGSIAVNGVCLTATKVTREGFSCDLSEETVCSTSFASLKLGDPVNLERAMRLNQRLEGHMVSGHVEGAGKIRRRGTDQNAITLAITLAPSLLRYCIPKGSIAVDGVSMTIQSLTRQGITLVLIPHTATLTTLGIKRVGDEVNIETDMIGRYIERLMLVPQGV